MNWQEMLDGTVNGSFQHPALRRLALPNFSGWESGRVWGDWDFDPEICNPDGALFGGYLAALADATAGHAMATTLGNEEGFATADLHISYHRPVRGGRLRFEGIVLSRSRQIGHVEVQFTGHDGELVATAHATEVVTAGPRRRGLGSLVATDPGRQQSHRGCRSPWRTALASPARRDQPVGTLLSARIDGSCMGR